MKTMRVASAEVVVLVGLGRSTPSRIFTPGLG